MVPWPMFSWWVSPPKRLGSDDLGNEKHENEPNDEARRSTYGSPLSFAIYRLCLPYVLITYRYNLWAVIVCRYAMRGCTCALEEVMAFRNKTNSTPATDCRESTTKRYCGTAWNRNWTAVRHAPVRTTKANGTLTKIANAIGISELSNISCTSRSCARSGGKLSMSA